MKKFFSLALLAAMALVGCNPNDPTNGGGNLPPVLTLLTESLEVNAAGGSAEVAYSVENPVEGVSVVASVAESVDWISNFDYSTEGKVSFTVAENTLTEEREAVVTVAYEGAESQSLTVKQAAADIPACTQHDVDVTAKYLGGNYFHDLYSDTAYNYNICLSPDGEHQVLDMVTGMVDLHENMPLYTLDLFAADPSAELNVKFNVPVGTYTFDVEDTCAAGTMSAGYTYMLALNVETYEYDEVYFTAGQLVVTTEGMDITLTDEAGKVHHVVYKGSNLVDNTNNFGSDAWKDGGQFSTLTADLQLSFTDNVADAYTEGDYFVVGKNYWDVIFFDFDTNSQFYLHVLAPADAESLSGEFPVSKDLSKSQMVLPGYVCANYASWSWYEIYDENDEWVGGAPLVDGKLVISDNADGSQHVVADFKDDLGHSIKAEFDTQLGGGEATPWSTRSVIKKVNKSRMQMTSHAKVKLQPIKR